MITVPSDDSIPSAIHRDDAQLTITWNEDDVCVYAARELRLACQCAGCVEEMSGRPLLDPATVPTTVKPLTVSLVGNYAIQIAWSDGHSTGIYTYRQLRSLCSQETS